MITTEPYCIPLNALRIRSTCSVDGFIWNEAPFWEVHEDCGKNDHPLDPRMKRRMTTLFRQGYPFLPHPSPHDQQNAAHPQQGQSTVDGGMPSRRNPVKRLQQSFGIGDDDQSPDQNTQQVGRNDPNQPSGNGSGEYSSNHQRRNPCPADIGPAYGDQEAESGGNGDREFARIHRTHHFSGFQPLPAEQDRRRQRSPSPPPVESTNPAIRPNGMRKRLEMVLSFRSVPFPFPNKNRPST